MIIVIKLKKQFVLAIRYLFEERDIRTVKFQVLLHPCEIVRLRYYHHYH